MAKEKYTGIGAVVEADVTGAETTYTAVGCIREFTLPPKTRTEIDATCLEDVAVDMLPGLTQASQFNFTEIWDPMDTVDASLDTAEAARALVNWRVTMTNANGSVQATFNGYIVALGPTTQNATSGLERVVSVAVNGPITYASP